MVAAAWWFRHQSRALVRRLADPRWRLVLAVSPDAGLLDPWWPGGDRIPQGRGDLGDRMGRVLRRFAPAPVLIVGADVPGIGRAEVAACLALLAEAPGLVLGPSEDGGYWAVGLRGPVPRGLFDGVRWSTVHALADTVATLPVGSLVRYGPTLRDVDEAGDL